MDPVKFFLWAAGRGHKKCIEDEYGRKYTYRQFLRVLVECPIRFYHSIGKVFS
jgi:hypothetical protein